MVQQIQACEWMENYSDLEAGATADNVVVVSCVEDGDITCHFKNGDKTKSFIAGTDRTLNSESVTIVSGKFDLNVR